jgi:hypothetical protein
LPYSAPTLICGPKRPSYETHSGAIEEKDSSDFSSVHATGVGSGNASYFKRVLLLL